MLVYRSPWLGLHCRIFALYNTFKHVKSIHRQFTLRLTLQFITQHRRQLWSPVSSSGPIHRDTWSRRWLPLHLPSCSRCAGLVALQPGVSLLYWRYLTAARSVADFWPRDHVTATLMALHWLPVRQRITYKLCSLMHAVMYGNGPQYLMDMVVSVSWLTGRSHQRSAQKEDFDIPRTHTTYGSRSFCCICSSTGVESLDGWHSTALRRFLLQETSQDLSVYDCNIPVSTTHAVGLHYVGPSLNVLSDQYNSYWIRT